MTRNNGTLFSLAEMKFARVLNIGLGLAGLLPSLILAESDNKNNHDDDCEAKVMSFCLQTLQHTQEECQEEVPQWCADTAGTSSNPTTSTTGTVMTVEVDLNCYSKKMDYCTNNLQKSQQECVDKVEEWCAPQVQLEFDHDDDCQVHKLEYCLKTLQLSQDVCEQKIAHWCARSPELCVQRKTKWCLEHQHQSQQDCQKMAELWCLP